MSFVSEYEAAARAGLEVERLPGAPGALSVFGEALRFSGQARFHALRYLAGLARVYPRMDAPYRPPADPQRALDEAWPVLDELEPVGKELLLEGLVAAVSHDGRMAVAEAELLRVACACLHCPLPPLLER